MRAQALCTGPNTWSKKLVTPIHQQGWCPSNLRFTNSQLWDGASGQYIPCPEEPDLFAALGLR
jgi:hypothetical protein